MFMMIPLTTTFSTVETNLDDLVKNAFKRESKFHATPVSMTRKL